MRRSLLAFLTLLAFAGSSGRADDGLRLEVVHRSGVAWRAAVRRNEGFTLSFVHSSEHCRWTHRYEAAGPNRIRQIDSTFRCFGAGIPPFGADGSALVRGPHGYTAAARADLGDLSMMAWRAADITLTYRGRAVPIGVWFDDFDRIMLRVR